MLQIFYLSRFCLSGCFILFSYFQEWWDFFKYLLMLPTDEYHYNHFYVYSVSLGNIKNIAFLYSLNTWKVFYSSGTDVTLYWSQKMTLTGHVTLRV